MESKKKIFVCHALSFMAGASVAWNICSTRTWNRVLNEAARDEVTAKPVVTNQVTKPIHPAPVAGVTNIEDNGLSSWLADTNHSFGKTIAPKIFVLKQPDGKYYIRWRDPTNEVYQAFFEKDNGFDTLKEAHWALSVNVPLQTRKAISDALEDALKPK